jgi:hypothetical protein
MVVAALSGVGGQAYLEAQAIENPTAFLTLVGKVLPLQVSGEGGGAMVIKIVRYCDDDAAAADQAGSARSYV